MARGVIEAYAFAASDPYRAVTHNKGISRPLLFACRFSPLSSPLPLFFII